MSTVRTTLAQIGCGYWGPNLLRSFAALPGCRLKWVAELRAERRDYVRSSFPECSVTDQWHEAVADPEVDGVIVATPAHTHVEMAREALRRGKHVLVEKPLAMTSAEADELGALAARQEKVLMVGHTFLYNAGIARLRDIVRAGELGDVLYAYSQRLNLGQVRPDINAWWSLAPHDVSILLWLLEGFPESVAVRGAAYLQPGIEDVAFGVLAWNGGITAHIHVSWLDPGKVRRFTVVGSRKMAVYDDVRERLALHDRGVDRVPRVGERMDFDDFGGWQLLHRTGDIVLPRISGPEPLRAEAVHFLECVRTGSAPRSGPRHARDVIAILEAGQQSLREGGATIRLPT
jgi:predicted dehydrogenase